MQNTRHKDGDMFAEMTRDVSVMVSLSHRLGTSGQMWYEHLGKYRKIRIKMNISQAKPFLTRNNTKDISVDENDEPKVRQRLYPYYRSQ